MTRLCNVLLAFAAAVLLAAKPAGAQQELRVGLMDAEPGQGPALHIHPYPETWIVHSGEAEFTVGEQKIMGKAGDIIVVDPETPHRFVNTGTSRLQMTCIHASDRVVQTWL